MAHVITIKNNCPFTIWPGIQGNPGHEHLGNGGFSLGSQKTHTFNTPRNWAGRIWGRTRCNSKGKCETGDCGNKIQCNGAGGVPPVSLAEMTFTGAGGLDFYDVSLVDGYNLPIRMLPTAQFKSSKKGKYDCKPAGCVSDLNSRCPSELAVRTSGGSSVVACKSACAKFNTDTYCCRGSHNTPATCKSSSWPKNYPSYFKAACPDAYSYAYDDTTSTFTCRGNPSTNYDVIFCP
uniref:PR-5-like protein n=1 Tax=Toxoptera citricida TaxID=223852 RepID=Q5I207_TOXCI|nr:PR-5-like protein [Aphis citricidus]